MMYNVFKMNVLRTATRLMIQIEPENAKIRQSAMMQILDVCSPSGTQIRKPQNISVWML
jgi:hypothetical protein